MISNAARFLGVLPAIFLSSLSLAGFDTIYSVSMGLWGALEQKHNGPEQIRSELNDQRLRQELLGPLVGEKTLNTLVINCDVRYGELPGGSVSVTGKNLGDTEGRELCDVVAGYVKARMDGVTAGTVRQGFLEDRNQKLSPEKALIKKWHPWVPVSRLREFRAAEPLRRLILIEGEIAFEFDMPVKITEDSSVSSFKVDRKEYSPKTAGIIAREKARYLAPNWSSRYLDEFEAEALKKTLRKKHGIDWKTPMELTPGLRGY